MIIHYAFMYVYESVRHAVRVAYYLVEYAGYELPDG